MVGRAICIDLYHFLSFSHQDFFFHSNNPFAEAAPMNKNTAIPNLFTYQIPGA